MQKPYLKKRWLWLAIGSLTSLALACGGQDTPPSAQATASGQVASAYRQQADADLPQFESTAAELQQTYDTIIAQADKKLAAIAALDSSNPKKLTFKNTILAYEEVTDQVTLADNRAFILKQAHPDQTIKAKANELHNAYLAWFNATHNHGGVYKVLKAFANKNPKLAPDEKKLMDDSLGFFQRNGLSDDGTVNPDVLRLQNEIDALEMQVEDTVTAANAQKNYFTAAELDGLSADQLANLDGKEGDNYVILSGSRGLLRDTVMTYANQEATRKRAKVISNSRAVDNIGLITTLVQKRLELAKLLGFTNWADYRTQAYMAKNGATASGFVNTISNLIRPKLDQEIAQLARFIQVGVNDDNGQIDSWDVYYFKRLYEMELAVDYGALSQYFPYESALRGMFDTYEKIFSIKIDLVPAPYVWHKDVQLAKVSERFDTRVGATIGYLYLDNFPRLALNKYPHAQTAGIIYGKSLGDGRYRKPVASLICNFPTTADGTPGNMRYTDIDTLFHEFGHALHVILSKTRFASLNGFYTPTDFVEVPSTMSEQWRFDPGVFKLMAIPDPAVTDEFVQQSIAAMKKADLATKGLYYGRQLGLGKIDFALHLFTDASQIPAADSPHNLTAIAYEAMASAYLPYPEGSGQLSSFLHPLSWDYDAGYYAYAWSDSIVAELAEVFEDPSNTFGYLNPALGLKYRREILEPGNSRDVNSLVETFTGQPLDPERKAFLKRLGL